MQSPKWSLIESVTDVGIGYVIAIATQLVIYPWFGVHVDFRQQLGIGAAFTVVSLVRRYVTRRLFNRHRTAPPTFVPCSMEPVEWR